MSYADQCSYFTQEKKTNPFLQKINARSAQATMKRLDLAMRAFFRRVKSGGVPGYPRFKAFDRFDSFTFPTYGDGCKLEGKKLRIQHIGHLKLKLHRPVEGKIKTVTIKKESDKWYAVFSCDLGEAEVTTSELPATGIDVGIEHFYTDADGTHEPNPRLLREALPALRRAQRALSRKKRGGSNRAKERNRVQKIHAKVRNQRKDHRHKAANGLVSKFGLIAVEKLNIKGMVKNHCLARAISDVGWGSFLEVLKYKAEEAGVSVVEVDAKYTSQDCSRCGYREKKKLSDRTHNCSSCGLTLQRDHNAAKNILARAMLGRADPVGLNVAEYCVRAPRSRLIYVAE